MKRSLALLFVSVALSLAASELLIRFVYYNSTQREKGADKIWYESIPQYMGFNLSQFGCGYSESVTAHPYLGFVHHSAPECRAEHVNNRGFNDRDDFPLKRDPNFYSILILGGSVAQQFAWKNSNGSNWLEAELNSRFVSPNGKPFRIFNGAMGGWSVPAQNNVFTLYGDSFDAAISVEGYNEALHANQETTLDIPETFVYSQHVRAQRSNPYLGLLQFLVSYRRFVLTGHVLKNFYVTHFLFEKGTSLLARKAQEIDEKTISYLFKFPKDWSRESKLLWNKNKYRTYLKMLKGEADAIGVRYVHFVQPIPSIGKVLTLEEAKAQVMVDASLYKSVILDTTYDLQKVGFPTFSLTDIFQDEKETIYSDWIHYVWGNGTNKGYEIMSKRVATDLGKAWRLSLRSNLTKLRTNQDPQRHSL